MLEVKHNLKQLTIALKRKLLVVNKEYKEVKKTKADSSYKELFKSRVKTLDALYSQCLQIGILPEEELKAFYEKALEIYKKT
jgi:hypothetical protein